MRSASVRCDQVLSNEEIRKITGLEEFFMSDQDRASVVESAVHARCAASSELLRLLSPELIFTGYPIHRHPPYISVLRKNARPYLVTNTGVNIEDVYFVLEIYHRHYLSSSELVTTLCELFDAAMWQVTDSAGRLQGTLWLRSEILENDSNQQSDGTWVWYMTMRVRVLKFPGI